MPITPQHTYQPLDQAAFGPLSYEVFAGVLAIRKQLGRFFDEKHYKKALALQWPEAILEAPILVSHGTFRKFYYLDLLIHMGGVFEFKTVETLTARHKAQLLHYLMLAELWHGLLINVRPEKMQREYVNNQLRHADRHQFHIVTEGLKTSVPGAQIFRSILSDLLNDWGTCLDLGLYEEAITHFCGGEESVIRPTTVFYEQQTLGNQNLRFVTEKTAFKLTAFESDDSQERFRQHIQSMVNHLDIESLLWANLGRRRVTIQTLVPEC
ncbi:MAG: GxxExxY protein [Prosthecobacter sp.]|jgi:GxxExxY protein|nr:GxxExxY protein [Prosthecobacter sp.]